MLIYIETLMLKIFNLHFYHHAQCNVFMLIITQLCYFNNNYYYYKTLRLKLKHLGKYLNWVVSLGKSLGSHCLITLMAMMSIGTSRPEMEIFIVVCHAMTVQPKKMALHSCQYSVGSINCIINFCISLGDTSCLKSSD